MQKFVSTERPWSAQDNARVDILKQCHAILFTLATGAGAAGAF